MNLLILLLAALALPCVYLYFWPAKRYENFSRYQQLAKDLKAKELK